MIMVMCIINVVRYLSSSEHLIMSSKQPCSIDNIAIKDTDLYERDSLVYTVPEPEPVVGRRASNFLLIDS